MATEYANGRVVTNGLVLSLDAGDRNSYVSGSTTWRDMSGNGYNGTLVFGPTFNSGNGGSIFFGGSHVSFANTTIGSFNNATFSYGAWFYFDGTSQLSSIITKRNDNPFNQYTMRINSGPLDRNLGTNLTCLGINDQGQGGNMEFTYPLPSSGWYHGTCVINNNAQSLYVNGVLERSATQAFSSSTFNITGKPLYVSAMNLLDSPFDAFKDRIAVTFLYNRALSATEVLQNYNATKSRFGL
jgi:hypothetical protein